MLNALFGSQGGATKRELSNLSERDQFSNFLPWLFYSEQSKCYLNTDNTFGYLWECIPLPYLGSNEIKQLESLLKAPFPKGSVLQFILVADPFIDGFLGAYQNNKTRNHELVQKSVKAYQDFLSAGTSGLAKCHGIPVRNFRLFIALKTDEKLNDDTLAIVEELLQAAHLAPRNMLPSELISVTRRLFNNFRKPSSDHFDKTIPLRKQIIDAPLSFSGNTVKMGDSVARCLTPKGNPEAMDPIKSNKLIGGLWGMADDSNQITTPFLWSVNIIFDDVKFDLHQKASLTMMQKATGSFAQQIQKRLSEFQWALDKLEKDRFVRIVPSLWIFASKEDELKQSVSRARRLWENQGFVMQEESYLSKAMLIASLPFGLYTVGHNLKVMDRDFIMPASTLARSLPIQGDYRGNGNPVLAFIGRKGQTIGLDLFDKHSNNHNFMVAAQSGSGKSFSLNYLCSNYYAAGSLVRIIDIGYSYKKLAQTCQGRFIDFGKEKVVINPFLSHATEEEDALKDRIAAVNVIAEMAYAASGAALHETEWSLIKQAVKWTIEQGNIEKGIDSVQHFLKTFPKHAEDKEALPFSVDKASELAFNLRDFVSTGDYGRFFNGTATFDISKDDFVVLELERLKSVRELFSVVVMQVMNSVTQDLYLSDRSQKRFILFEEAAQFLKQNGLKDFSRLAVIIEEGYRRARKYQGAFGVVLQSLQDIELFGGVGNVITTNSAYKFYLQDSGYGQALSKDLMSHGGFAIELIQSVRNNKPRYSEMFIESPLGSGVARLVVDPWTYWVNTSEGSEVARFEHCVKSGQTPMAAIETLSGVKL